MSKQSMEALEKATRTREERREVKEELRWRELLLPEAMKKSCIQTMEIRKLLTCLPGVREAKTARYLKALGISPSTQVQNLSDTRRRQLEELVG